MKTVCTNNTSNVYLDYLSPFLKTTCRSEKQYIKFYMVIRITFTF